MESQEYWLFPHEVLKHSWVIVRQRRPYVPVLQGVQVPTASTSPMDSAKYFSLFFRPWTFQSNDAGIPHICTLGLQHLKDNSTDMSGCSVRNAATASFVKHDTQSDSPPEDVESDMVKDVSNFAASWASFLRKGVHSSEAAQLIQTLLINAMPTKDIAEEDCDKAAESGVDEDIPTLAWRPDDMRALLQRSQIEEPSNETSAKRRRLRKKSSHTQAFIMTTRP